MNIVTLVSAGLFARANGIVRNEIYNANMGIVSQSQMYVDMYIVDSMTSLAFRNEEIPTVFEYAQKAGIQGIECGFGEKHIKVCDNESFELVKKLSKERGIEVLSLGSYCDMTDYDACIKF